MDVLSSSPLIYLSQRKSLKLSKTLRTLVELTYIMGIVSQLILSDISHEFFLYTFPTIIGFPVFIIST